MFVRPKSKKKILSKVVTYSALQKNWTFWGFPYKMTRGAMVENHLKVMLNPPIFSQMLVLMWEAYQ